MRPIKALESACLRLSLTSYERPRTALVAVVVVLLLAASQLPRLQVNTSVATLLGVESPAFSAYQSLVEHFGHDVYALITVSADDVLDPAHLGRLRALHEAVADASPVIHRVTSLLNAPMPRNRDGRVVFAGALNPWPESPREWASRQDAIVGHAPFRNVLVNPARDMTVIAIQLDSKVERNGIEQSVSTPEYARLVDRIKPIMARFDEPGFSLELTGEAAADAAIQRAFVINLAVLGAGSFLLGIVLIWWLFGHWQAALAPVLVIVATIVACFGAMAAFGQPLLLTATILPPLIVGLGVADTAHVLNAWSRHAQAGEPSHTAFRAALSETVRPVLMTTLTTAAGLFSFTLVEVQALASFGLLAGFAAVMAGIFTLVFVALVLAGMPQLRTGPIGILGRSRDFIDAIAQRCVAFAWRWHRSVVLGALVLGVSAAVVLSRLELNHDTLEWVPPDWTEVRGMALLDEKFRAASSFEVVVDTGKDGGALEPAFFAALRDFAGRFPTEEGDAPFSSVISVDSFLKEISSALDGKAAVYHEHANASSLLWRDMRLFQIGMPGTFSTRVSDDYRLVRVTLNTTRDTAMAYDRPVSLIDKAAQVSGLDDINITGFVPVLRQTLDIILNGAVSSFVLSMLAIATLMGVFFRSAGIGVISLLPNVTPILAVLAFLALLGRSLDMITIMIGSLVIGVIVDDTIHFVANYQRGRCQGLSSRESSQHALRHSGHAMLVTTLVLIAAFSVLGISELENLGLFAAISGGILLLGLPADFVLMPALMRWIDRDESTTGRH